MSYQLGHLSFKATVANDISVVGPRVTMCVGC